MEPTVEEMGARLDRWDLKIEQLAAKTDAAGIRAGIGAHMYIDQLKALRAVARSQLDRHRGGGEAERGLIEIEMKGTWDELAAALVRARP